MTEKIEFVEFYSIDWVEEMVELIKGLKPGAYWSKRLSLETQSRLSSYIVLLGQHMREMEYEYNIELYNRRVTTKTKADAEILAKQSVVYKNWKLAKTFREDLTNLVFALRAEAKSELQDAQHHSI
jgi:hypothetical protein